ncbi:hypothetical protein PFISCL1PPCAC_22203, partial [Pristionchus fissidentatus]
GIFRCLSSTDLLFPITIILVGVLVNLSLLGEMTMVSVNFPITAMSFFAEGFASLPVAVISLQMIITLSPAHHRASALALMRLTEAIVRIPASQLIGLLSDVFRGEETSTTARFYALRNALLCVWFVLILSSVAYLLVLRFYREDVAKARESERRHALQSTPLISRKSTLISRKSTVINSFS